jgi:hypothetical protein
MPFVPDDVSFSPYVRTFISQVTETIKEFDFLFLSRFCAFSLLSAKDSGRVWSVNSKIL